MKNIRTRYIGCILASVLLTAGATGYAQNNPLVTIDENGVGTLVFPGSSPIPTPGVLAPDPGPGGLPAALTYNLLGPPSLVAGDLILLDGIGGAISDIIRFNPVNTSPGYPASLVFYSDNSDIDPSTPLADTGFPSGQYTNLITLTEIGSGVTYTPTANQPGFVSGFGVTYSIISDADVTVPEPATTLLMGIGEIGLGFSRRWSRHR